MQSRNAPPSLIPLAFLFRQIARANLLTWLINLKMRCQARLRVPWKNIKNIKNQHQQMLRHMINEISRVRVGAGINSMSEVEALTESGIMGSETLRSLAENLLTKEIVSKLTDHVKKMKDDSSVEINSQGVIQTAAAAAPPRT